MVPLNGLQSRSRLAQDTKPGDLLGASYWVDDSDEGWVDYQNKELNNGRLAMVAIMGMITQDTLYGDFSDQIFKPLVQ